MEILEVTMQIRKCDQHQVTLHLLEQRDFPFGTIPKANMSCNGCGPNAILHQEGMWSIRQQLSSSKYNNGDDSRCATSHNLMRYGSK